MLTNNDSMGRWVNGTVGVVDKIEKVDGKDDDVIWVKLESGGVVDVTPNRWEMYKFSLIG